MNQKEDVIKIQQPENKFFLSEWFFSYVTLSADLPNVPWLASIFVIFTCHAVAGCHCHHGRLGAGERTPAPCQLARVVKTQGRHSTILIFIVPDMKVTFLASAVFMCPVSQRLIPHTILCMDLCIYV